MPTAPADRRLVAVLSGLCLALLVSCGVLGWKLAHGGGGGGEVFFGEEALRDPEVRREVIRKLSENAEHFDSHPDPEVGRILIAERQIHGTSSNAIGVRERPFELDKPPGVVRIVLLGDSYVFGLNIPDPDRLGAVLERHLGERARAGGANGAPPARFECLHLAVNSWNLHAECTFVRRQIDRLRPDLVLQVSVANDLDDVTGVRGFGAEASFAPRHGARADSVLLDRYPGSFLNQNTRNFLARGEDWESRSRFADALEAIRALRAAAAALPGSPRHVLIAHWGPLAPALHRHLGAELEPDSIAYLPLEFSVDKSVWLTPGDAHWNVKGHAQVAEFLYGLIRTRGLLPDVELAPWPEAERLAEDWSAAGLASARDGLERMRQLVKDPVAVIDLPEITLEEARQVHGGLDREGLVSPYASLVLHRAPGTRALHVAGRALPDRSLAGARTRVFLEELEVGALVLRPDAALELRVPVPAALDGREFLDLRLESSDYVYRGDDARHCVVFRLERAALE